MTDQEKSMPFIKNLASSDRKARDKALDTLRTFLTASTTARSLSALENLKLWKGLFYSLYMCDRPIPQQNLCNDLARLLDVLPDEAVIPWLTGFWDVLSREWTSIDVLRMEKFLLLVRRVLGKSLAWVHGGTGKKGEKRREELLALFIEWPFETSGDLKRVPVGLRLHVLDIWIDEAEKVGIVGEDATEKDVEFLTDVKGILEEMVKNTVKPIKSKAKESLADERLPKDESAEEDGSGDDEDKSDVEGNNNGHGWGGFDD